MHYEGESADTTNWRMCLPRSWYYRTFPKKLNNNQEVPIPMEVGHHNRHLPFPPFWMDVFAEIILLVFYCCVGDRGRYLSSWFIDLKSKRNHVQIWWNLNWMKWLDGSLGSFPWWRGWLECVLQLGRRGQKGIQWLKSRNIYCSPNIHVFPHNFQATCH